MRGLQGQEVKRYTPAQPFSFECLSLKCHCIQSQCICVHTCMCMNRFHIHLKFYLVFLLSILFWVGLVFLYTCFDTMQFENEIKCHSSHLLQGDRGPKGLKGLNGATGHKVKTFFY